MTAVAERPTETQADSWRVIGQGTVFRTERYPSGLPARQVPYAQYYEVAKPGSSEVAAEVEFADRPHTDYADLGREFPVDITVLARGSDGEFSFAATGTVRSRYLLDEAFILGAARLAAEQVTHDDPARFAADLEALMN